MAETLQTISTVLYYVFLPFIKLLYAILFVLSPFWTVTQFLLLPFTHLVQTVLNIVLFPFRLHLLDRVETIYIYLGIAGLIGFFAGAILYFSFNFLSSTLNIDPAGDANARHEGRTTAEYRAARNKKRQESSDASSTPVVLRRGSGSHGRKGLPVLSQTIMEEEESDF
ncbi:hypothetical protein K469DRAFT_670699 [Zopfia rhizophila CBS 207.26]|uniref:Uncharacterized protein n=1 Tax=Zopfia rhizophila CBS 207.26 TaxID=1314779 RepID=A0A6A6DQ61_9PEZI|nr:hypothetical protein K469DRAFT_670699 [Zopfia rhizophila CBS 207.26]